MDALCDQLAGRPWVTKLHFPVHCVSRIETRDRASGHRFVTSYKYHHGYFGAFVRDPDGNNVEAVCHVPGDG